MSNHRNVNNQPGTSSNVQQLTPQQQIWKVLSFHETRLNNIESMIDVILRALPWEARLEATDIEKYRKVGNGERKHSGLWNGIDPGPASGACTPNVLVSRRGTLPSEPSGGDRPESSDRSFTPTRRSRLP